MKKEGDESILDEDSEDQGKEEEELAHSSEREEIE